MLRSVNTAMSAEKVKCSATVCLDIGIYLPCQVPLSVSLPVGTLDCPKDYLDRPCGYYPLHSCSRAAGAPVCLSQ
jgi:hypothetical protein